MTSPRRHGLLEPATNLLRTTVASAAAVLGGADLLTVVPADGRADGRWARLAANVPALLRHEAGLAALGDATRGSWCVEGLTEALARRAWDRFRDIEREGGLFAAARSGWIAETLAATVARREARVACGDRMVVGVTDYAPLDGTPLPVAVAPTPSPSTLPEAPLAELLARAAGGARLAELLGAPAERITPVVRPVREAATYEELRAPADHQAAGGSRPAALAICWGRPVEHRSAIDRARRWLAVAGIRLETGAPVRTATEALERWTESGLDIAICCPPGRGNDQLTVDVARLLEGHGPGRIAWAVRPDAPVTAPVFAVGTDRLAALRDLLGSTAPAES